MSFLLLADLDQFAARYAWPRHNSVQCCGLCLADKSDDSLPWTHFSRTSAALATTWTSNAAHRAARPSNVLMLHLPGVGITSCMPDHMHCKHSGTDAYLFGSIFAYMCRHYMPGTEKDNCVVFWACIKKHIPVGSGKTQFYDIGPNMFPDTDSGFPLLKGRASQIRHLGPPLLAAFTELMDQDLQEHRWMRHAVNCSVKIEAILDDHRDAFVLPKAVAKKFEEYIFDGLTFLTKLRNHFGVETRLFHITIKAHYLMHIALQAHFINPRLAWCYGGEDFMGIFKKIIACSQRGTPMRQWSSRSMLKYAMGLSILLQRECDV